MVWPTEHCIALRIVAKTVIQYIANYKKSMVVECFNTYTEEKVKNRNGDQYEFTV